MHLLHERRFSIDDSSRPEHTVDLGCNHMRLQNVLENGLDDDAVERPISEWKAVAVGQNVDVLGGVDVGPDDIDQRIGIERFHPGANAAAANDQHPGAIG